MTLKACLNGPRQPGSHPAPPVAQGQLAAAAAAVADAGAVQLHVQNAEVADTLDVVKLAESLNVLRVRVPDVPFGVTTGASAAPDPADRFDSVTSWTVLTVSLLATGTAGGSTWAWA